MAESEHPTQPEPTPPSPFQSMMMRAAPIAARPAEADLIALFDNPAWDWVQAYIWSKIPGLVDLALNPVVEERLKTFYSGQIIATESLGRPEFKDELWAEFEDGAPPPPEKVSV